MTSPCLAPMPPLNEAGLVPLVCDTDVGDGCLVSYVGEVLGVLEECNIKLEGIRELMDEGGTHQNEYK